MDREQTSLVVPMPNLDYDDSPLDSGADVEQALGEGRASRNLDEYDDDLQMEIAGHALRAMCHTNFAMITISLVCLSLLINAAAAGVIGHHSSSKSTGLESFIILSMFTACITFCVLLGFFLRYMSHREHTLFGRHINHRYESTRLLAGGEEQ